MDYEIIEDTNKIYAVCLTHELYLEKGLMLEAIYEQRNGSFPCKAVRYKEHGIAVIVPEERGETFVYSGMLFTGPEIRKQGIGRELVKRAMALADTVPVYWNPWDVTSSLFFRSLIRDEILTNDNFTAYRHKLMELADKILADTAR